MFGRIVELLRSIDGRLASIEKALTHESRTLMSAIDDLAAQVAASTSAEASAVTLITGLVTELEAALNSGGSSVDQNAKIEALVAQLKTSSQALADAITVNTPAAPSMGGNAGSVDPNAGASTSTSETGTGGDQGGGTSTHEPL